MFTRTAELMSRSFCKLTQVPASDEERVQGAVRLVQLRRVSKVVDDYKHLVQFLHFQLLGRLRDLALLLDDAPQRRLVPLVPVGLLPLRVHPQVLLDVLLDGDPAIVYVDTWAECKFSQRRRDTAPGSG